MKRLYIVVPFMLMLMLSGCTAITEFSRRSEVTINAKASASVLEAERTTDSHLVLHGSNRDVLAAYEHAMDFTIRQLGLSKKEVK